MICIYENALSLTFSGACLLACMQQWLATDIEVILIFRTLHRVNTQEHTK